MPIETLQSHKPRLWILYCALFALAAACDSGASMSPAATEAGSGATPASPQGSAGTTAGVSGQLSGGAAGSAGVATAGAGAAPAASGGSPAAGASAAGTSAADGGSGGAVTSGSGGSMPAGSGEAAAGASGSAGDAAAGSGGSADRPRPKCKTSPKQVVVVGDSYINWITHTFPDDLAREAGETWRMYAVGGCSLGSGGLCMIPDQLDQAIQEDPNIIASVMDGGGNDILIADENMFPGGSACKDRADSPSVKVCQDIVATAMAAGEKLMQTAADAGIRDAIYLFYPHIPGGGFGGMNPNPLLDYSLPMARALCEGAEQRTQGKLRCHFIDLVPVFEGHTDWFADDGIHENSLGSAAIAKEVVRVAKENCIAQPESSGCCEP